MHRTLVGLFCASLLFACAARAQDSVHALVDARAGEIDRVFSAWSGTETPGAAVAVVSGSEVVLARGYGMADIDGSLPITPETRFMIASVSKQFTAFAAAVLEAQGQLVLDTDVRRWLPDLPDYGTPVTVRHLIHHTSGLRDSFDLLSLAGVRMDDPISAETILQLAYAQEALNYPPGSAYSYSNTGYVALARIVESVTGKPFADWMDEAVFGPLRMDDTFYHTDRHPARPNTAVGYGQGPSPQLNAYESVGETGLYTNVLDMARWAANFLEPVAGGAAAVRRMADQGVLTGGDTLSYAFGQRIDTFRGRPRTSHSGWHRGFRSHLARFPDERLAVVVLANSNELSPSDLALEVADILFRPGADSLEAYTGTYEHAGMAVQLEVDLLAGRPYLRHPVHGSFAMVWTGPDAFAIDSEFLDDLIFERVGGRIVRMKGSTSRSRNMVFARVE